LCNGDGRHAYTGRDLLLDRPEQYAYHQCADCGAVYLHPLPDAATIASFYPESYSVYKPDAEPKQPGSFERAVLREKHGYAALQAPAFHRALARLFGALFYREAVAFVPAGRMLDVGCGNGRFLRKMAGLGWACEGLDFSETAVAVCRAAGLNVRRGDLFSAGLGDASFDLVTARHVIEHVPDPAAFVREAGRILKPGGRLLIQTPNSAALGRPWFGSRWFANDIPRHLVLFSRSNLDRLAARSGLAPREHKTFTTPKIFLNSLDYRLKRTGRPSRKSRWRRLAAKSYVALARVTGRGDELYLVYQKL
jgi:2-polyprenyl-3-methyl-5-hydroxy-6-metoxy-1,4-benzoquinol methylase